MREASWTGDPNKLANELRRVANSWGPGFQFPQLLRDAADEIDCLSTPAPAVDAVPAGEVERLREALTPSGDTKAAYHGEFRFDVMFPSLDEDDDEPVPHPVVVPTPAGRSWFVLATSGPTTSDPAAGSSGATLRRLPTPMASDGMKDGAGGGAGSTYPFRQILSTPRASDMKAGGHGDAGWMGTVRHQLSKAMLPTPIASFQMSGQSNPGLKAKGVIYPAMGPLIEISAGRQEPGRFRGDMEGWARLPTPRASDATHGPEMTKVRGEKTTVMNLRTVLHPAAQETLPTPTKRDKRDKRMDAWSPAYDKRKSPTMDAVLDGAQTGRAPDKWAYARQIAAILTEAGLIGPSETLPVTYGWMLGYRPGRFWLSCLKKGVCDGKATD